MSENLLISSKQLSLPRIQRHDISLISSGIQPLVDLKLRNIAFSMQRATTYNNSLYSILNRRRDIYAFGDEGSDNVGSFSN